MAYAVRDLRYVRIRRLSRLDVAVLLSLLVLGGFQFFTVLKTESYLSDSSAYIGLARNILDTGRYEFNYRPHIVYPPGFPLILAGLSVLTGAATYDVFIRFMPVFGTIALMVWYLVLRRPAGPVAAAVGCLLVATSVPLFQLATRGVMSDLPFFLFSGLALWSLAGLERAHSRPLS